MTASVSLRSQWQCIMRVVECEAGSSSASGQLELGFSEFSGPVTEAHGSVQMRRSRSRSSAP